MHRRDRVLAFLVAGALLTGAPTRARGAGAGDDAAEGIARAERAAEALLERLREREAQLDARERRLEERSRTEAVALAHAEARMAALDSLRIAVDERLARLEQANEAWLGRLATIYGRMPAERAAAVLAELDPELAAAILGRMRASRSASVLSALPARRAAELSRRLAHAPRASEPAAAANRAEVPGPASAP
jgi:flagellar motility protein MotE (MotC chaperone)